MKKFLTLCFLMSQLLGSSSFAKNNNILKIAIILKNNNTVPYTSERYVRFYKQGINTAKKRKVLAHWPWIKWGRRSTYQLYSDSFFLEPNRSVWTSSNMNACLYDPSSFFNASFGHVLSLLPMDV